MMIDILQSDYRFTLCFLFHGNNVLMIERQKEPNLGMWNGVGGHIEIGESPENSCRREIIEETGITVPQLSFNGVLTWEDWTFGSGGMYIFSAELLNDWFQSSEEGDLAWKPYEWVMTSPLVVSNIPEFMPDAKFQRPPRRYHCLFDGDTLLETRQMPLPAWVDDDWVKNGKFGL